jgi:hypothetical protein
MLFAAELLCVSSVWVWGPVDLRFVVVAERLLDVLDSLCVSGCS